MLNATTRMILKDAREIWMRDAKRLGWSIRDAVELAVDGLRQEADEQDRWDAEIAQRERELEFAALNA